MKDGIINKNSSSAAAIQLSSPTGMSRPSAVGKLPLLVDSEGNKIQDSYRAGNKGDTDEQSE